MILFLGRTFEYLFVVCVELFTRMLCSSNDQRSLAISLYSIISYSTTIKRKYSKKGLICIREIKEKEKNLKRRGKKRLYKKEVKK